MTGRRDDNCGPGPIAPAKPGRNGNSMEEFDALPASMRKVLADAPFDFATQGATRLVEERGLEQALAVATKNIPLFVREAACRDFGPRHPQCATGADGENVTGGKDATG